MIFVVLKVFSVDFKKPKSNNSTVASDEDQIVDKNTRFPLWGYKRNKCVPFRNLQSSGEYIYFSNRAIV